LLAAYIPDSRQAVDELMQWILSKIAGLSAANPKLEKITAVSPATMNNVNGDTCYKLISWYFESEPDTHYYGYIEVECSGGAEDNSGGDPDPGGDVPCHQQLIPGPECAGDNECPPPYYCSGGGGGGGGGQDQDDSPDPCLGDPVESPEIAPAGGWNEWGGQFGYTRYGGNTFHDGTDIKADINSNLSAMHGGTVTDLRNSFDPGEYRPDSYGNYARIKSTINGDTIYLRYNHLNTVSVEVGDTISAGDIIGKSGNTGNAQTRGNIKVIPHVHIRARKVVNGQETKVDPEDYMATTFNNDGSVDESESDCNKFQ